MIKLNGYNEMPVKKPLIHSITSMLMSENNNNKETSGNDNDCVNKIIDEKMFKNFYGYSTINETNSDTKQTMSTLNDSIKENMKL